MSAAPCTPGEWEIGTTRIPDLPAGECLVVGVDYTDGTGCTVVAVLCPADRIEPQDIANGALIAASKRLLDNLICARDWMQALDWTGDPVNAKAYRAAMRDINSAISAATGFSA